MAEHSTTPVDNDDLLPRLTTDPSQNTKTPLFEANHADRYQRQRLITQIQGRTRHSLVCYVSGSRCAIDEDDTMPFVDLLHRIPRDQELDLLLHTGGGSIDAAEKLMHMLRRHVGAAKSSDRSSRLCQECRNPHGARCGQCGNERHV